MVIFGISSFDVTRRTPAALRVDFRVPGRLLIHFFLLLFVAAVTFLVIRKQSEGITLQFIREILYMANYRINHLLNF